MKALIFGITGQDGSYLADMLLGKGYEVHGVVRRSSRGYGALENIAHLVNDESIYRSRLFLHSGDLCDGSSVSRVIDEVKPDELYAMSAQADVQESFFMPEYSIDVNGNGVIRILEAIRRFSPVTKMVQASTSELFGGSDAERQNEESRMEPKSPYSLGKYVGYRSVKQYREAYGLFACNSIAFNHASPRRTDDYVDAKVTKAVARIKLGQQKTLRLGNLAARRDWSYAPEICEALWLMLQQGKADDYVLGSGVNCTVQEWVDEAFNHVGLSSADHVVIDKRLFRPVEVDVLLADARKAKDVLGWEVKTDWKQLCHLMVDAYLEKYALSS